MIYKKYEDFLESVSNDFNYINDVIVPIFELLRKYESEDMEKITKMVYIYIFLHRTGFYCWGDSGVMGKIDRGTEYDNVYDQLEELGDIFYSKSNVFSEYEIISYKEFFTLIKDGKALSDLDKKQLVKNKTFDQWVEILLDKDYRYKSLFENRAGVADYLLCTIGTGFTWNKEGYIIEENNDEITSNWENAKLNKEDVDIILNILSLPQVKLAINRFYNDHKRERVEKERVDADVKLDIGKITKYYPISSSSNIYALADDEKKARLGIYNFHESYIKAAKEICTDILNFNDKCTDILNFNDKSNINFAIKFMAYYGDEKYIKMLPETFDKYKLYDDIEDIFLEISDTTKTNIFFNNTANSDYGDNSFKIIIEFNKKDLPFLPKGTSNDIQFLKGYKYYDDFEEIFSRLNAINCIKYTSFKYIYIDIDNYFSKNQAVFHIHTIENEYNKIKDDKFDQIQKKGFLVDENRSFMYIEKHDVYLEILNRDLLNKDLSNITANILVIPADPKLRNINFNYNIPSISIDENTNNCKINRNSNEICEWLLKKYEELRMSDPEYKQIDKAKDDDDDIEQFIKNIARGLRNFPKKDRKHLKIIDFLEWLKNNQD